MMYIALCNETRWCSVYTFLHVLWVKSFHQELHSTGITNGKIKVELHDVPVRSLNYLDK